MLWRLLSTWVQSSDRLTLILKRKYLSVVQTEDLRSHLNIHSLSNNLVKIRKLLTYCCRGKSFVCMHNRDNK